MKTRITLDTTRKEQESSYYLKEELLYFIKRGKQLEFNKKTNKRVLLNEITLDIK